MRLSFISQFKIEILLPFTSCRKVLEKIPAYPLRNGWPQYFREILYFEKTVPCN